MDLGHHPRLRTVTTVCIRQLLVKLLIFTRVAKLFHPFGPGWWLLPVVIELLPFAFRGLRELITDVAALRSSDPSCSTASLISRFYVDTSGYHSCCKLRIRRGP